MHNEGLHNLYSVQDIVRMIKSGRMRWVELVDTFTHGHHARVHTYTSER
jgi:hypothetical protein